MHGDLFGFHQLILGTRNFSDELRRTALHVITRTGNLRIQDDQEIEALLCEALACKGRKVFGLPLSRRRVCSDEVRAQICETLGHIGRDASRVVLQEIVATESGPVVGMAVSALKRLDV